MQTNSERNLIRSVKKTAVITLSNLLIDYRAKKLSKSVFDILPGSNDFENALAGLEVTLEGTQDEPQVIISLLNNIINSGREQKSKEFESIKQRYVQDVYRGLREKISPAIETLVDSIKVPQSYTDLQALQISLMQIKHYKEEFNKLISNIHEITNSTPPEVQAIKNDLENYIKKSEKIKSLVNIENLKLLVQTFGYVSTGDKSSRYAHIKVLESMKSTLSLLRAYTDDQSCQEFIDNTIEQTAKVLEENKRPSNLRLAILELYKTELDFLANPNAYKIFIKPQLEAAKLSVKKNDQEFLSKFMLKYKITHHLFNIDSPVEFTIEQAETQTLEQLAKRYGFIVNKSGLKIRLSISDFIFLSQMQGKPNKVTITEEQYQSIDGYMANYKKLTEMPHFLKLKKYSSRATLQGFQAEDAMREFTDKDLIELISELNENFSTDESMTVLDNYMDALNGIIKKNNELKIKYKNFDKILANFKNDFTPYKLESFFIQPVQRPPRYDLLFEAIIKEYDKLSSKQKEGLDIENVRKAFARIQELNSQEHKTQVKTDVKMSERASSDGVSTTAYAPVSTTTTSTSDKQIPVTSVSSSRNSFEAVAEQGKAIPESTEVKAVTATVPAEEIFIEKPATIRSIAAAKLPSPEARLKHVDERIEGIGKILEKIEDILKDAYSGKHEVFDRLRVETKYQLTDLKAKITLTKASVLNLPSIKASERLLKINRLADRCLEAEYRLNAIFIEQQTVKIVKLMVSRNRSNLNEAYAILSQIKDGINTYKSSLPHLQNIDRAQYQSKATLLEASAAALERDIKKYEKSFDISSTAGSVLSRISRIFRRSDQKGAKRTEDAKATANVRNSVN